MKSNNKTNLNFVKNFKYFMILPIILIISSIVLGILFGINFDYDFKTVSVFDVKFNTTVTDAEYIELERSLDCIIDKDFDDFRIERIGEGAQNGLLVKIANEDSEFDEKIVTLKSTIEADLLKDFTNKDTTSITVTTTDTNNTLPKNVTDLILYSVLAIVCLLIFAFLYNIFRYNFVSGITIVLTILSEIVMLTSVMIVARVPFNYYFVVPYFVMIVATIFMSAYINNEIKSKLNVDKYNKYSNSDRIYDAVKRTFTPIILFEAIISLLLFAVMFFGNISLVYTIVAILISNVISLFFTCVFNTTLWSYWYKKDKDAALRRRIDSEKKKLENKNKNDDEKIVV